MIAISYRREDSLPIAGRLYDRLQIEFGKGNVFMDFDSIPYGVDFREHIKEMIDRSKVLVAVIGPGWFGRGRKRTRRIDDPSDFIRLEIAYAFQRELPVIPVLINDTPMPTAADLPPDIEGLAFRNALILDVGIDFHHHTDRLITGINRLIISKSERAAAAARESKIPVQPETLAVPPVPSSIPLARPPVPPVIARSAASQKAASSAQPKQPTPPPRVPTAQSPKPPLRDLLASLPKTPPVESKKAPAPDHAGPPVPPKVHPSEDSKSKHKRPQKSLESQLRKQPKPVDPTSLGTLAKPPPVEDRSAPTEARAPTVDAQRARASEVRTERSPKALTPQRPKVESEAPKEARTVEHSKWEYQTQRKPSVKPLSGEDSKPLAKVGSPVIPNSLPTERPRTRDQEFPPDSPQAPSTMRSLLERGRLAARELFQRHVWPPLRLKWSAIKKMAWIKEAISTRQDRIGGVITLGVVFACGLALYFLWSIGKDDGADQRLKQDYSVPEKTVSPPAATSPETPTKALAKSKFRQAQKDFEDGHLSIARAFADQAHQLDPDEPSILNLRGKILMEQREFDLAEYDFQKAIEIDPNLLGANSNLEEVRLRKKAAETSAAESRTTPSISATPNATPVVPPGTLKIDTDPQGAAYEVIDSNGKHHVGTTPTVLHDMPIGYIDIIYRRDGFSDHREGIWINAGKSSAAGWDFIRQTTSVRMTTTSPSVSPTHIAQTDIVDFVRRFVSIDQLQDGDAILSFYTLDPNYFGTREDHNHIRKDIEDYKKLWPVRRDSIEGDIDIKEKVPDKEYAVHYKLNFYAENPATGKWEGQRNFDLEISIIDGVPKVSAIQHKVVHQQKGKIKAAPPPNAIGAPAPAQRQTATNAKLVYRPQPAYPRDADRTNVKRSGRFKIIFDERGNVNSVEVVQSTGSRAFDSNTTDTLKRWRATPGVASQIVVPITYAKPKTQPVVKSQRKR